MSWIKRSVSSPEKPTGDGTGSPVGKKIVSRVAAGLLAGGFLFACCLYDPEDGFFPRCPINRFTGLLCPGCGFQRAIHALSHGDVVKAVRFNPLVLVIPVVLAMQYGWKGRRSECWQRWILYATAFYFVLRNFPCFRSWIP